MINEAPLAERIVYGTPIVNDDAPIPVAARPTTALIGRLLLGAIFIVSGVAKLTDTTHTAEYMTQVGIPSAHFLAIVAGTAEVLGGIAVITGLFARLGALGLIAFMIPTTLLFHDFWNVTGAEQKTQMVNFMKNLAIIGGLALLFAHGPGRYSIDAKLRRPMQP